MTKRQRVLVINHFAVPRSQPGGTRHIELFERLGDWDFTIIASRLNLSTRRRQAPADGFRFVPVIAYNSNGLLRILNWISFAVMAIVRSLRLPRPTVVYASSPHLLAALAGWSIAQLTRSTFVLEIRDLWPQVLVDMNHLRAGSLLHRGLSALEGFLYRRAERIVVLAPGSIATITARGVPEERICLIPNAADPDDFRPSSDRATLRTRYGLTRMTGVYAGAHGPANGLELLLNAAASVSDLPVDIVLAGDGVEKSKLQAKAAAFRLTNVRFVDPIAKSEMPDLLHAADFAIHVLADVALFRASVSPNKVFDYLAAGRCVLTNCPGIVSDLVTEARAGLAVAPSDLSSGLRAIVNDPARVVAMGESGRQWISTRHTRTATVQLLRQVLAG